MITRRRLLDLTVAATFTAMAAAAAPALAQPVSVQELEQPGPLGDVTLGDKAAKAHVIEYASLTCSHCAEFHEKTWPEFKKKYVDTGKVRFTLREFPLDPLAAAGFMLARCEGNDRYYPVTDLLFSRQKDWAYAQKPLDGLIDLLKQAGFTREKVEACLKDQKLFDAVTAVRDQGAKFGVNATPSFFINGKLYRGALSMEELDKALEPVLGR
ncbi:DsbA family protein [Camelimonas abortus]|uniref:DsbA family protein n=1 Tax=Camelimonas abortus TaxID=1017184 RepID=A0ABV7LEH2_9HYPH